MSIGTSFLKNTWYVAGAVVALDDSSVTLNLRDSVLAGFQEDKDIILARQRILEFSPDAPMLAMRMDAALASFRTMVETAIAEERTAP